MLSHQSNSHRGFKHRALRSFIILSTLTGASSLHLSPAKAFESQASTATPSPAAVAAAPSQPQQHWLPSITTAIEKLDASKLPSVSETRKQLDTAVSDFEKFLDRTPEHKEDWFRFLKWDRLKEELAKEKADPEVLLEAEKIFRQNFNGLELNSFTKVRNAIAAHANAVKFGQDPDRTLKILSNRLSLLAEQIKNEDINNSEDASRDLRQTVEMLNAANQTSDLVRLIEGTYARPNARVLVTSDFVARRFGRGVNEHNPVCEDILGTTIIGNSVLVGSVTPTLIHNPNQATLRMNLFGDFTSNNVGHNRGVKLYTQGNATVHASETVVLGEHGLHAVGDTSVNANLSSQIHDIDAKLRIIERIAAKTAAKQKPQADAIAEQRMENRIRNQFHNQLSQQLSESNAKLGGTPVELRRLGLQKPTRTSWSSNDFLSLLWKVDNATQLSAAESCPHIVPTTGMVIQLHESVVTNTLNPILEGRTLRSEDGAFYRKQFGELASSAIQPDDAEPWSLKLASYQPVEAKFHDGLITLRIRTTRLDRGDRELDQSADIQASYLPQLENGKLQLVRQGDVHIRFYGKQATGMRASTLRTFLKRKFDEVFREQLLDKPLDISDRLPDQFKDLRLRGITSEQGWIQAHLD